MLIKGEKNSCIYQQFRQVITNLVINKSTNIITIVTIFRLI